MITKLPATVKLFYVVKFEISFFSSKATKVIILQFFSNVIHISFFWLSYTCKLRTLYENDDIVDAGFPCLLPKVVFINLNL